MPPNTNPTYPDSAWALQSSAREEPGRVNSLEDLLRPYLDLADALFLELTDTGTISFVNEYGLQLLGWTLPEIAGRDWFELCVPESEQPTAREWFQQELQTQNTERRIDFETVVVSRRGEQRRIKWTQVVLKRHESGARHVLTSGHDITTLRNVEASLDFTLKELHAYKFALDASSILAITDRRGRITFANDKFCAISQYNRKELLGEDHRLLNSGHHPPSFFKKMWRTISSGRVWRADIRNKAKDGTYYWVDTTIVPVLDEATHKPREYIAVRNEVTQRKNVEAKLEMSVAQLAEANRQLREEHKKLLQAEKMASIGLLAAGVAHEVNNPLSGVMACLKAIEEDKIKPERRSQYFATARDGLERIQQTVRGLLDFSRQRPPAPAHLLIADVIDASSRLIAPQLRKKNVALELSPTARQSKVYADRPQLMQAIVNLLLNATYVSPDNSMIEFNIIESDHELGLVIADFGPGMSDDIIERACDPFFSTKPEGEGTGLGLAVTQTIAQAHEGRLVFERRPPPETGTIATLWLPNKRG